MGEKIWEKMFTLGRILHWFGRFEEMQVVDAIAAKLREAQKESWEEAIDFISKS